MTQVRVLTTGEATSPVLTELRALVDRAFRDFSDDDWGHALGGWHVVASDGDVLVAHAAVVARRLEVADQPYRTGYVEAVATAPDRQRAGLGSLVMGTANDILRREFEMGALSTGRHNFYSRLGWERWEGPTFVRRGTDTIRTPDEDDGVMVLRFGPSEHVDLAGPILCEGREGDDW